MSRIQKTGPAPTKMYVRNPFKRARLFKTSKVVCLQEATFLNVLDIKTVLIFAEKICGASAFFFSNNIAVYYKT